MRGNRRRDTKPELKLRAALHKRGLRYRVDFSVQAGPRPVRPDVVFTRQRVAVFLDGCFWHRCPEHGIPPRANSDYWKPKLDRNVERDRAIDVALTLGGWAVIRIWEHEDPEHAAERIAAVVRSPKR
jgi:DNA mismatch endonuclease (patch repair protein)